MLTSSDGFDVTVEQEEKLCRENGWAEEASVNDPSEPMMGHRLSYALPNSQIIISRLGILSQKKWRRAYNLRKPRTHIS
ncbi:hypothetical protein PENANT_c076G10358 [Penicillium antarcticum]|uniref:Uncharacterized protein n=1 Tax=Penicillium antarcticum TaxID=416450 RepID=A0A1V6PQ81_9EURO|nr:hypothetical protein PENANT_c076G10358 [Penicillium antarcticum]